MSRHAVRATVAVAALSLSVLGPPVQAQDNPSAQELADLSALAEAGATEAQYSIGVKYDTGEGVPQDDAEAVIWYRRAAEQGHAGAQYSLGRMYDIGRGAPEDGPIRLSPAPAPSVGPQPAPKRSSHCHNPRRCVSLVMALSTARSASRCRSSDWEPSAFETRAEPISMCRKRPFESGT